MKKISLLEHTGMLIQRIENIINSRNDLIIETINPAFLGIKTIEQLFNDSKCLIIDIDNFESDADAILTKLRQNETFKTLPVLIISSKPNRALILKLAKFGNADVLLKPFNDFELLEKILKHLNAPILENMKAPTNAENSLTLRWDDAYKIGVEIIDEEHKLILDNFEKLYVCVKAGQGLEHYNEIISFLEMYINSHFEHEERLQELIRYDRANEHKSLHENFKTQIFQLVEEHPDKEVTNLDIIKLLFFIKEWIVHHILVEDKSLGIFLKQKVE